MCVFTYKVRLCERLCVCGGGMCMCVCVCVFVCVSGLCVQSHARRFFAGSSFKSSTLRRCYVVCL